MMNNKHNQQGFSLFMVMIMMIVIALLVVITSQTTSTESRLSANEADRKYALAEAEIGLRAGEEFLNDVYKVILEQEKNGISTSLEYQFTANCKGTTGTTKGVGLCSPVEQVDVIRKTERHFVIGDQSDVPAWERPNIFEASNNSSIPVNNGKSRFIIEYMGQREVAGSSAINDYFRVTSRARGENQNTVVTLQSYIEMTRTD